MYSKIVIWQCSCFKAACVGNILICAAHDFIDEDRTNDVPLSNITQVVRQSPVLYLDNELIESVSSELCQFHKGMDSRKILNTVVIVINKFIYVAIVVVEKF